MVKLVTLMADYYSSPLWWRGDLAGNIALDELPLTEATRSRLQAWADQYDVTLNREDPASSGFPSQDEADAFVAQGYELLRDLRRELGPDYEVVYRPEGSAGTE